MGKEAAISFPHLQCGGHLNQISRGLLDGEPVFVICTAGQQYAVDLCIKGLHKPWTTKSIGHQIPSSGHGPDMQGTLCCNTSYKEQLCLVCGDEALGYHYGVSSCEACKAFFMRTIRGYIEYRCRASNDCKIIKRHRNVCRACRFAKCLLVGMKKECVKLDRVKCGQKNYKRKPSDVVLDNPQSHIQQGSATVVTKQDPMNAVVSYWLVVKLDQLLPMSNPVLTDAYLNTMNTLRDLADQEIVNIISWANNIPGFSSLSQSDQKSLLRSAWMEVFLLCVIFRSLPYEDKVVFAEDIVLHKDSSCSARLSDLCSDILHLIRKYQTLYLEREEYNILKGLALTNSDSVDIEDPEAVLQLRDNLWETLNDYESNQHPEEPRRHERLLLTLPLLRQMAGHVMQHFISQ
ncbi:steroid hormone receptor ERR1-like [Bombina bombina]|uniref:steroid hormone receptor ERR1-like n=1 Tax=Bombina bombina TaxID=8345 RepID=UPI00235B0C7F|nr:steroid hormone receptor ERR1-like [Bombina bombina]